jgi:integrase
LVGTETEKEMRIRLRFVRSWVDKKTGRVYSRLRRRGLPELSLPGLPGSPEFLAAYNAAMRGEDPTAAITTARRGQGTINAAVALYLDSNAFASRVPSEASRKRQASTLRQFCRLVGDNPLALLDRKYIDRVLADAPTMGVARIWLITIRPFLEWAVKQQMIAADPTAGIKIKQAKSKGHDFFNEEQIAQFEARWPIGTRERLMFALLLYTGQRCSDVRQLGRHSIVNGKFPVKQIKTGVQVYVPVHPALAATIEACNIVGLHSDTFLATKDGRPIVQSKLNKWFRKACLAAGLPAFRMVEGKKKPTCVPHGLRKQFCVRLAQAGATTHEIAALSGHLTLKEVERYTKDYNREKAGEAGFAKLLGRAA